MRYVSDRFPNASPWMDLDCFSGGSVVSLTTIFLQLPTSHCHLPAYLFMKLKITLMSDLLPKQSLSIFCVRSWKSIMVHGVGMI